MTVEDFILPVDVLPDGSILGEDRNCFGKKTGDVFTKTKVRAWSSLANLFPGLHPDGFEDADSGWRRGAAGEITEAELYPSDAQWCGLYDRMHTHEPDEMERRLALAADYGEAV